jgi:hypothetical protein
MSRVWDAGECLALTDWTDRRIYTHDFDNNVFRVAEANGDPSGEFVDRLPIVDRAGQAYNVDSITMLGLAELR